MSATGCKMCNRIVLTEHTDEEGNCFYCAPENFDEYGQLLRGKRPRRPHTRYTQDEEKS